MPRTNLIAARKQAMLSQAELADKIRASREEVSLWERGIDDPQPAHVRALCAFLGTRDPDDLLKIEEENGQSSRRRTKLIEAHEAKDLFTLDTLEVHIEQDTQAHYETCPPDQEPCPTETTSLERTPVIEVREEREIPHMNTAISLLKQERLRRGWSRDKVEALTEARISSVSLERWEERKAWPRAENIDALCKLYRKTPEELELVKGDTRGTMGTSSHLVVPQEGIPMSDLVRRAIFSNLGSKLTGLIDLWPKRNYAYEELQAGIYRTILDYNPVVATALTTEQSQGCFFTNTKRDKLLNKL